MTHLVNNLKRVTWRQFLVILLLSLVAVGFESCKSTGNLTKKERKAQIEMYKKQMRDIISGTTTMSYDQQQDAVNEAMNKNFGDPKLDQLILQATQKLKKDHMARGEQQEQKVAIARNKLYDLLVNKENLTADQLEVEMNKIRAQEIGDAEIDELIQRLENKIREMRQYASENVSMKAKLEKMFETIADNARAGDLPAANSLIQATLNVFSAPDVPVLIIISREGNIVDYDKPTTIINYLNLIKDQKVSRDAVDSYKLDSGGKIKELDLIKK